MTVELCYSQAVVAIQPTAKLSREGQLHSQSNAICPQRSRPATGGVVSPLGHNFLCQLFTNP